MSSITIDVPTVKISENDLQNLLSFIYKHEQLLKEFGAIKIQPLIDCKLALKKRHKNIICCSVAEQVVKISEDEPIYSVQKVDYMDQIAQQNLLITDEFSFWSSLTCSSHEQRLLNTSLLPNKSFFCKKTSRTYFDIHRFSSQSLLKLGGSKATRQFVPCVRRAHGCGAIFPLTSAQQRLFSIDYHHEGGVHYWYIIPTRERDALRKAIDHQNSSACLDHGQLLVHPSVLDKNHIRYHRIIQRPNEFVVLSAGTLAQSFTENASWSESIAFALPSWIEEGHASVSVSSCQCNIPDDSLPNTINATLFSEDLVQKYITSHLNMATDDRSITLKGS
jgi:hypothetical protein